MPHSARSITSSGWLVVLVLASLAACATHPKLDASEVPHALVTARADLEAGRTERALDTLRAAANAAGLATETRDEVQRSLETAALKRIDELSAPGQDPSDLADLVDLDLPRQIAVEAGLRGARGLFAEKEAIDAYRLLRRLDTKYPEHHERAAAGELLVEIGLWLVTNGTGWLGIGHSTDDAEEVLEYTILHHPSAPRCDEAYATLARVYEDDRDWTLAIERLENLVLFHPNSPLRIGAQARVPHLRLVALRSPEYDRAQLLKAESELEEWLKAYNGREFSQQVTRDLADCIRRLVDNDMIVAAFYKKVGNAYGAHYHAERAVEEARTAGDTGRVAKAEVFLRKLPPVKPIPGLEPPVPAAPPVPAPPTPDPAAPDPAGAKEKP